MPSIQLVIGLAQEFGVSPAWFLLGEGAGVTSFEPLPPSPPHAVREPSGPSYNASPNAALHQRIDEVIAHGAPGTAEKIAGYLEGLADQSRPPARKTA